MKRTVLTYIIGSLLAGVLIFGVRRVLNPTYTPTRTITTDVVQGILVGVGLAFITLLMIGNSYITKVNGWTTMTGCGEPDNGLLRRAACNVIFLGPVNVPQEAMYWTTSKDGAGHTLNGQHNYIIHFPAGQLPSNHAFWSLTMSDAKNRFVANPVNRYSVGDRSGLVPNADGSIEIYIQNSVPAGHETNWLPAPSGKFVLWLRAYLPGQTILDGDYKVPPVVESQ
ncbi:MAG: DUF1214 domain-containing protein [Bacteroidota bacterium]